MAQRELTGADYVAMLRRHWVLILVLAVIGGPLAYGVSLYLPDRYKSQTLVLVDEPAVPTNFVQPVDTTDINERLASMQQQILSRSRLEPIIRQYGLYASDINSVPMEDLVEKLQKAIEVTPVQPMAETRADNLPGFFVNVTLDTARTAQQVCTAVTSMFIEENLKLRQEHSEDTTQFLSQQLADAKASLDAQDAKLAAFKSHYLGALPDNEQTNLNLLTGLTSQLDATTQAISRAQQDKTFSESVLAQQVSNWQASQNGHDPDSLQKQVDALQTQLVDLRSRYTDDYPDVIKMKADIAALQKQIAESGNEKPGADSDKTQKATGEPIQITQTRAQIHSYDQVIAEKTKEQEQIRTQIKLYESRVQSTPAVEEQYKELTRGYQTALESYNDLQKKVGESQMATNLERKQEGEQFRVLDPASLPSKATFPNRPLFAAGGLGGGLALGIGIAFVMEMQNSSLRSERDVEFALKLPVLAMVPAVEPLLSKKPKSVEGPLSANPTLNVGARA